MTDERGPFQMQLGKHYKDCRECGETKSLEEFYSKQLSCKDCCRSAQRKRYRNRPEWLSREYEWKKRGILGKEGRYLKHPEFLELLDNQAGQCAVCRLEQPSAFDFVPDHQHLYPVTRRNGTVVFEGPVRGVLCKSCNLGLGKMYHSPDLLRRAAEYLEGGD